MCVWHRHHSYLANPLKLVGRELLLRPCKCLCRSALHNITHIGSVCKEGVNDERR